MIRMTLIKRSITRDVSEETRVGAIDEKRDRNPQTNTCCSPCSRNTVMTYSHREGFGVARITPAPKSLLRGRVTIIAVIHPNLHFTCNKKKTHSIQRIRHSEHCIVNGSYGDTREMCDTMKRAPQYPATTAQ